MSDVVKIKIKIKDENLTFEEIAQVIITDLKGLIKTLEEKGGNVQQLAGTDAFSSIEYVHLKG